METRPFHFIEEPITVEFDRPPALEKSPPCPSAFRWQGETFKITALLEEWHDYRRRGRMARNMAPAHAAVASNRGSLGVGRFYFRVQVEDRRIFEIYYDRAPKGVGDRKGSWYLLGERQTI
jgi:hypothetical protein